MRSSDLYQFWFLALLKPSDRVLKLTLAIPHLIRVLSVDPRVRLEIVDTVGGGWIQWHPLPVAIIA
jgi:hypothetical protein